VRHIVNVASVAAFRTFTSCAGYSAAKEGQRGLTRVLVEEARALGVRVTGLYPGAVDTPIWDGRAGFDRTAMLRPADVAGVVVEIIARPELAVEELVVMPPAGAL
jgi:NAD(P)-dependent dehydrogenase (short-subunit alcohol dehydrogenase family)